MKSSAATVPAPPAGPNLLARRAFRRGLLGLGTLALGLAGLCAGAARAAPTPAADLAKPPPTALHFTILSSAGKHGESARWISADGLRRGRESMVLRGQVFETDSAARIGKDGLFESLDVRGFTPNGDAAETFRVDGGRAVWKSPVDAGAAPIAGPAEYVAFGGPMELIADEVEALVGAPGRSLALLPGGRANAEKLTTITLGTGPSQRRVTAYAIMGLSNTPIPVWVDEQGRFFAFVQSIAWLPAGQEGALPILEKAQDEALAARSPALLKALLKTPAGPVVFRDVRAFVGGDRFLEHQSIVIDGGIITQVGPAAGAKIPAGAQVIEGAGMTLVPGLWDSHMHVADDASGAMLLSLGVTSVRDPGNVIEITRARAQRRAHGELLMPHVYPSVLIDCKGPNAAQGGSIAASQEEALAIVRKAKAEGFVAIKIYGSFNPAWVQATAAEAHRLGLHVHGHVPQGMRPSQAIEAGYDEITHINFVMMEAMPDSVVAKSNGIARFEGPGRYAKDVDLGAPPMKSLVATMAARRITADPTLVTFEGLYVPENGELSAAYAPFAGTLPPVVERGFRQGGFTVPEGLTRADYRRSFAKLQELVGVLHRAGVPIVAGTDGSGLELVRELELYVEAGLTPAEALATATIATARLVGADAHVGAIAPGMNADLVLVEGDPSRHVGDLRHTRIVVMDGKLMDADALRTAGGFGGRPKFAD